MGKSPLTLLACAGLGLLSACATAHTAQTAAADKLMGGVHLASTGAGMVKTTVGETYNGLGAAARAPMRDFNMMQEPIPVVLLKAKASPYQTEGLTSCAEIEAEIRALDVELGPDVDAPRVDDLRSRSQRLASMAAAAALGAATSAVDHYIPVRGVVRELSGATKYEREVARATLAGSIRRGFLKAVGMQQNCAWPAAPVDFKPKPALPQLQIASASQTPAAGIGLIKIATASTTVPSATVPSPPAQAAPVPVTSAQTPPAAIPPPPLVAAAAPLAEPAGAVVTTARIVEPPAAPAATPEVVSTPEIVAPPAAQLAATVVPVELIADHAPAPTAAAAVPALGLTGANTRQPVAPGLR